jgi:hypothetical protein
VEGKVAQGAQRLSVNLMAGSGDLNPDADFPEPDLAAVECDDVAMAEALAEARWHDADDEDVVQARAALSAPALRGGCRTKGVLSDGFNTMQG